VTTKRVRRTARPGRPASLDDYELLIVALWLLHHVPERVADPSNYSALATVLLNCKETPVRELLGKPSHDHLRKRLRNLRDELDNPQVEYVIQAGEWAKENGLPSRASDQFQRMKRFPPIKPEDIRSATGYMLVVQNLRPLTPLQLSIVRNLRALPEAEFEPLMRFLEAGAKRRWKRVSETRDRYSKRKRKVGHNSSGIVTMNGMRWKRRLVASSTPLRAGLWLPRDERDPLLGEKLRAEYPAILHWMIQGCAQWQAQGLNPRRRPRRYLPLPRQ
jgi:hypothetical protein